jgi:hypothetical protein
LPNARPGTARKSRETGAQPTDGKAGGPVPGTAAVVLAEVIRVSATEAAGEAPSGPCELSAADEKHDLSRHWRNSRTHASHDPASWKYHYIGNFMLNDVPPPNHGQL